MSVTNNKMSRLTQHGPLSLNKSYCITTHQLSMFMVIQDPILRIMSLFIQPYISFDLYPGPQAVYIKLILIYHAGREICTY